MKLEKSAQPVSEFELAAGEELHAVSGEVEGEDGAGLLGLEFEAVDVPVSIGISSKFAVHTGPKQTNKNNKNNPKYIRFNSRINWK